MELKQAGLDAPLLLLRPEDRSVRGWGHRSRAVALAEAAAHAGVTPVVCASDAAWGKALEAAGVRWVHVAAVDGADVEANALLGHALDLDAHALVLDGGRFNTASMQSTLRGALRLALIDDNGGAPREGVHVVVNPNVYATSRMYGPAWNARMLLGAPFVLLRAPFARVRRPVPSSQRALLSLGGAAPESFVHTVRTTLERAGFTVRIAQGLSAEGMVEAIDDSSLVVCGASVTLHEVWSRGRRALPLYQAPDQRDFRDWCVQHDIPFVQVLDRSVEAACAELSARIAAQGDGLHIPAIDANGADRVMAEVRPLCDRVTLRLATTQDLELLLAWRNDPETRAASHHTGEVKHDEHRQWLHAIIANPRRQLFVAEERGRPIGTVRADETDGMFELSWTVAPEARGKGAGKHMVRALAKRIDGPVRAEVRVGNAASARIAEYAGMQRVQERDGVAHYQRPFP